MKSKNRTWKPFFAITGFFALSIFVVPCIHAQFSERWEHLGPVTFSSIAAQSSTVLIMTTTDGWLYKSSDYGSTWKHIYIDDTLSLVDAKFADSLHGTLAAVNGTILFTSDGGATWSRSQVPGGTLIHIAYPAPDTAYVCSGGEVWQTTDRGSSWSQYTVSGNRKISAFYFFDNAIGFAVGNAGLFAMTTDAGQHWATQDIGAGDSIDLECMDFYGRDTGVVAGAGYSFATTDGGTTWRRSSLLPTGYGKPTVIKLTSGHQFFGFIDGIDEFSSTDLGASFRPLQQIFGSGEIAVSGVCSVSGHRVIIVGGDGEVEQSLNSGLNWDPLNLCLWSPNLINFGDSIFYGIGGYSGTAFYSSANGGDSWGTYDLYRPELSSENWRGLWFDSPNHGVAVNQSSNNSLSTTDGGLTWSNTGIAEIPYGNIGVFQTQGNAAIFPANDSIFITKDHGNTWVKFFVVPDTASPYPGIPASTIHPPLLIQVSILDSNHAYLAYQCTDGPGSWDLHYHERFYQTADAGQTWQEMNNAPFDDVGSIYFRNPSFGFLCQGHGLIYRTSDGGASWQSQSLTGDHGITAVNFLNDTLGFCVANDASIGEGQVFITTNGGLTWRDDSLRSQINGKRPWITGIMFPDSNTVILLAHEGFFRRHLNFTPLASVVHTPSRTTNLDVYPNPTTSLLDVEGLHGKLIILDALGRTYSVPRNVNMLDVSLLPAGLYFLSDGVNGTKFVKK